MNMIAVWIFMAVLFLVIELLTVGMVSIWLFAGSLAALLTAAIRLPIWLQIVIFLVVSCVCFVLLYPRLKKFVRKNHQATNADMALGKTAVVVRRIDNIEGTGAVSIDGKTWSARSADDSAIEPGTYVTVDRIQGVKLIVFPLSDN
ncbi:MAG: NfeD family protein [Faecousia sp.]